MRQISKIETNLETGLDETLRQMYWLEQSSLNKSEFVAFVKKQFAGNCKPCLPGLVWAYVRTNFKYVNDSPSDEVIRAPHILLKDKIGDCDDFALFIKTCLDVLGGFNTEYFILGKKINSFSHIVVYCDRGKCGNKPIDPLILDGANPVFNQIKSDYKFFKKIKYVS